MPCYDVNAKSEDFFRAATPPITTTSSNRHMKNQPDVVEFIGIFIVFSK